MHFSCNARAWNLSGTGISTIGRLDWSNRFLNPASCRSCDWGTGKEEMLQICSGEHKQKHADAHTHLLRSTWLEGGEWRESKVKPEHSCVVSASKTTSNKTSQVQQTGGKIHPWGNKQWNQATGEAHKLTLPTGNRGEEDRRGRKG